MSGQLSPDGQWMWDGANWVPLNQAPPTQPTQTVINNGGFGNPVSNQQTYSHTPAVMYVKEEKSQSKIPWIGVALILVSLFMPYISVLGFGVSGFEMMELSGELLGAIGEDGGEVAEDADSDDFGDLGTTGIALAIGIIMFVFSPFLFMLSAIVSGIVLLMKRSPKAVGIIHLSYSCLFILACIIVGDPADLGITVFSFIGFGFYLGGFASGLLLIK